MVVTVRGVRDAPLQACATRHQLKPVWVLTSIADCRIEYRQVRRDGSHDANTSCYVLEVLGVVQHH